ncbi:hypothetical protein [Actinoallomurus acanthiterrae]
MRITTRNARFQQWAALLANRTKRQRSGEFVVRRRCFRCYAPAIIRAS